MELRARDRTISFPRRPLIMGIVNLNDDSFCGDGSLELAAMSAHAIDLMAQGADIIDVGAESARTNRIAISPEEEISRLAPFLKAYPQLVSQAEPADKAQVWPPLLSVNSWRTEVVKAVVPLGVDLLNDLSALPVDDHARTCAGSGVALLIMHSIGLPKQAHRNETYTNVIATLETFFEEKIALALNAGLTKAQIVLDPGIDFAKQRDDNLRIYRDLFRLTARFAHPFLLPISRKTVIDECLGIAAPIDRDPATVACLVRGLLAKAALFRVHNVEAVFRAAKVIHAIETASVEWEGLG